MSFKIGDVVKLRSGGASMTVLSVGDDGLCLCVWHNVTGKAHTHMEHRYPTEALIASDEFATLNINFVSADNNKPA